MTMLLVYFIMVYIFKQPGSILLSYCFQLKNAVDKRATEIRKLEKRINEIVDRIYKDFSKVVGVANIREYEENHLKAAQYMAEERLSLSNQLSKLKYQYVIFPILLPYFFCISLLQNVCIYMHLACMIHHWHFCVKKYIHQFLL